jgi:hypothetical protein
MNTNPDEQPNLPRPPIVGYEKKDANAKWIFRLVIFLFMLALVMHGILASFLTSLKHKPAPTDAWRPAQRPSRAVASRPSFPRLQVSPPLDLQAYLARAESELNSYGWANRTSGLVRIPIEQAMDLVLQAGLPTRSSTNDNRVDASPYQLIEQRIEHREPEIQGAK